MFGMVLRTATCVFLTIYFIILCPSLTFIKKKCEIEWNEIKNISWNKEILKTIWKEGNDAFSQRIVAGTMFGVILYLEMVSGASWLEKRT